MNKMMRSHNTNEYRKLLYIVGITVSCIVIYIGIASIIPSLRKLFLYVYVCVLAGLIVIVYSVAYYRMNNDIIHMCVRDWRRKRSMLLLFDGFMLALANCVWICVAVIGGEGLIKMVIFMYRSW